MIVTKYILKSCIIPEMTASNKPDAIKELTHLLFEKKRMKGVGPALDQVMAREMTESTGVGKGISVPHARVTGMKSLACSIGRVPEGLDFLAVDRKPVYLIFLICYPPEQQTTYLNFVATLAKLLGATTHLDAMLAAPTAEDMYNVLEEASTAFNNETTSSKPRKLKTDPALANIADSHADVILLARLQFWKEQLDTAKSGKKQIRDRIENVRSLVETRLLNHFDRLMKSRAPALVPVEGDTCQGCFIRLPSKFVQEVRQDTNHIYTCTNCSRYIYVV